MSNVKESKELVDAIVAVARAIEVAKKDKFSLASDISQLVVCVPAIVSGLQGMNKIGDELKVIDEAGIEELVADALLLFGDSSEKSKLYVKEGLNILLSVFKIFKA